MMPLLKKSRGASIINVSSIFGIVGDQFTVAYSASKGAVRALTKSAALHCAGMDPPVRVNSVHPGFVLTPNAMAAGDVSDQAKKFMVVMNAATSIITTKSEYMARTSVTTPPPPSK